MNPMECPKCQQKFNNSEDMRVHALFYCSTFIETCKTNKAWLVDWNTVSRRRKEKRWIRITAKAWEKRNMPGRFVSFWDRLEGTSNKLANEKLRRNRWWKKYYPTQKEKIIARNSIQTKNKTSHYWRNRERLLKEKRQNRIEKSKDKKEFIRLLRLQGVKYSICLKRYRTRCKEEGIVPI